MPWPNQFGVAMVVGLALVELLASREALRPGGAWAVRALLLVQVAQSGSRNAWLVLAATLAALVARKVTPPRRVVALGALFAAVVLTLPVPARQLGLRQGSWLPAANRLISEPRGWSPSLSPVEMSLSLRSKLWREAAAEIRRHPVAGLGPNVFQATAGRRVMGEGGFNAHSLALEAWVALGTVGLGLLGVATALAWVARGVGSGAGGLPLAVLLLAQVLDCFTHDPTMVVLMVLAGAAVWHGRGRR
jgi:O-antigen ligase